MTGDLARANGFHISPRSQCVAAELVEKFKALPVANVSDAMGRLTSFGAELRPLHGGNTRLAGPAVTVRTRPGDNLMIHKAIDLAEPGDVIVVDGGGDLTNALIGSLMISYAATRGIAGFVINGAVRDLGWIRDQTCPIYAAGVTHRGPYKDGPGEINTDIALGSAVVAPGDLILGDEDGLVSVPFERLESVYEVANLKTQSESRQMEAIARGLSDRSWINDKLQSLGCEMPEA